MTDEIGYWSEIIEPIEPEIGMGVVIPVGYNDYPGTIVGFNEKKTEIYIKQDNFKPDIQNGYDYYSNQIYIITPNVSAPIRTFTLRKNNRWIERKGTQHLIVGYRKAYQFPVF